MKAYISGKITGLNINEAIYKFKKASERVSSLNLTPVNPFLSPEWSNDKNWKQHMKTDISLLLQCDAIFMQKDWRESKGATLEYDIAKALGMLIIFENE